MQSPPLKEIIIELTNACNQQCIYCTNKQSPSIFTSLKEIKNVLLEAKELHIPSIRFTGGEPLLHPSLNEILSFSKNLGFYIILNTNATLLTSENLNTFKKTVDHVLISFQGFNTTSDRALTKTPHVFIKKITNTLLLLKHIPYVRAGTVITPFVLQHLDQYASLFQKLRLFSWGLFRPIAKERFAISKQDYQKLILQLYQYHHKGLHATIGNALPFCILPHLEIASKVILGGKAEDGHSRLVFNYKHFFKPSYFIDENLGTSIKEALKNSFLQQLQKTSFLPSQCQNCFYLSSCLGGCRALSYLQHQSYFHVDPFYTPIITP